jgi:hypothetical protein
MLMTNGRRAAIRTLRGWAISVLQEANAIHECEYHGWAKDRADPHARDHAVEIARHDPPPGLSPDAAEAEVREVLDAIGDTCPECPPRAEE